jgi:hypothetical protein
MENLYFSFASSQILFNLLWWKHFIIQARIVKLYPKQNKYHMSPQVKINVHLNLLMSVQWLWTALNLFHSMMGTRTRHLWLQKLENFEFLIWLERIEVPRSVDEKHKQKSFEKGNLYRWKYNKIWCSIIIIRHWINLPKIHAKNHP